MSDYGGDDEYEYDIEDDDDALYYTEEPVYEAVRVIFNPRANTQCAQGKHPSVMASRTSYYVVDR